MPDSLSSPVTTGFLQGLVLVAAWLLAVLAVLLLFVQNLRGLRASRSVGLGRTSLSFRMRDPVRRPRVAVTHGLLSPLIDEPKLLVVTPPDAEPASREEGGDGSSSKSTASAVSESDARPLVSLLGPLTIHGGKRSRRGLRARALELIAFLALRREGAQRDEILEALWPGEDPQRSRQRLYQAVRDARRLLGDAVASERDRYWLDRDHVQVDVDELGRILAKGDKGESGIRVYEQALALFRGAPLAGSDFLWCEGDIRRLRGTYVELLEAVGRAKLEAGDARCALEAAERGLEADPLNEVLWRLGLRAEGRLGLRQAVEIRYGTLRETLTERLGLEPAQETRSLYRDLLGQR